VGAVEVNGYTIEPGANLRGANLRGANLSGVDLAGANFEGADLSGANLTDVHGYGTRFALANLTEVNLLGAEFNQSDFSRANLTKAKLSNANFYASDFGAANLSDADLTNADLSYYEGEDPDGHPVWLHGANLSGAHLEKAHLRGAILPRAIFTGARLWNTDLHGANLREADFTGAILAETDFVGANLCGANFTGARLGFTDFTRADLTGANLSETELFAPILTGAVLTGADVRGTDLEGVDLNEHGLLPRMFVLLEEVAADSRRTIPLDSFSIQQEVKSSAEAAGIQRLCHFTRVEFLPSIFRDREILPTSDLLRRNPRCSRNDASRRDEHLECVSFTVQYPNLWVLDKFRDRYPDCRGWVILILRPDRLWGEGTLYSPVNAATHNGEHVRGGIAGFNAMFQKYPPPHRDHGLYRGPSHLSSCPTDNQAEVLVPEAIPIAEVIEILYDTGPDYFEIRNELKSLPEELQPLLRHNPEFFDSHGLTAKIWRGVETPVRPETETW
jgi:uncharacterized protein YjbI with pentapeptide repeats